MIIRRFEISDLKSLTLQDAQIRLQPELTEDYARTLDQGEAYTVEHNGQVIACGGIVEWWSGRGEVWALISKSAGSHFTAIHKAVKRFLTITNVRRVEARVDVGFNEGCRWLEMLGFEYEGRMKAYLPNGNDSLLYARVK